MASEINLQIQLLIIHHHFPIFSLHSLLTYINPKRSKSPEVALFEPLLKVAQKNQSLSRNRGNAAEGVTMDLHLLLKYVVVCVTPKYFFGPGLLVPYSLVVYLYPSEKYEFVNWDDDIPKIWENNIHVPVTTNQHICDLPIVPVGILDHPLFSMASPPNPGAAAGTGRFQHPSSMEFAIVSMAIEIASFPMKNGGNPIGIHRYGFTFIGWCFR